MNLLNELINPIKGLTTALVAACALTVAVPAAADASKPNELISRVSQEVLQQIKSDPKIQAGDFSRISALVDATIMPHVDFRRMTALSVGRGWRKATDAQRESLQAEFRTLLLRTYSGALTQFRDESIRMKKMRGNLDDGKVIVRSQIIGRGDPIELNYRLRKAKDSADWRIYDLNVLGVWLVNTYRSQFKSIVSKEGIDGLIKTLRDKNAQFAKGAK